MFVIEVDHTEYYKKNLKPEDGDPSVRDYCLQGCGLIPSFVGDPTEDITQSLSYRVLSRYSFPVNEIKGATLRDDGFYIYPEDQPLAPYARILNIATGEKLYIYPYGLVIFSLQSEKRDEDGKIIWKTESYRMD